MKGGLEIVQPAGWPAPRGYANGVVTRGRTLHVAGQSGWDAASGQIPSDDLAEVVRSGVESRQAAVAQAEAIIETRVQSFMHWIGDRAVVPVIRDLHESSEAMRLAELERARKLLAKGEDIDTVLDALSKGLTAKFLHGPQQALHRAQGDERARLASLLPQLFRGRR